VGKIAGTALLLAPDLAPVRRLRRCN